MNHPDLLFFISMCVKFRIILDDEPNAFLTQSQHFRKVLHLYDDI